MFMKKFATLIVICLSFQTLLFAQTNNLDKPAYLIYNAKGEIVSYSTMIQTVTKVDVCLFGELHNDPISHWLELEIMKSLYQINLHLPLVFLQLISTMIVNLMFFVHHGVIRSVGLEI